MLKRFAPLALVSALLVAGAARADDGVIPPDPVEDPLLVTAGFLTHHQDLKYRLLGMEAYREQRFDDAMRYFRRAGFFADKPSQGMVAEMYWNGEGVPRDRAAAYAWMDLAAERGYAGFLGLREEYWAALDASERQRAIELGQDIYARFGDDAAKPRYKHHLRIGRRNLTGSRVGFSHGTKIIVPGPGGGREIDGSEFYDERYWEADKYWAWQDKVWMRPRIGRVEVGAPEVVGDSAQAPASGSRIPVVAPEVDAVAPAVPDEPTQTSPGG